MNVENPYLYKNTPKKKNNNSLITFIDDDNPRAFSFEETQKLKGTTTIVGIGERKFGKWEDDEVESDSNCISTSEKIETGKTNSNQESTKSHEEEDIAEKDESDIEFEKSNVMTQAEANWIEFQQQLSDAQRAKNDKNARKKFFDDDPVLMMRRSKEVVKNNKNSLIGPPNRFNIKPGLWWDGIDRSNGYERKRYEALSNVQSEKNEIYINKVAQY